MLIQNKQNARWKEKQNKKKKKNNRICRICAKQRISACNIVQLVYGCRVCGVDVVCLWYFLSVYGILFEEVHLHRLQTLFLSFFFFWSSFYLGDYMSFLMMKYAVKRIHMHISRNQIVSYDGHIDVISYVSQIRIITEKKQHSVFA